MRTKVIHIVLLCVVLQACQKTHLKIGGKEGSSSHSKKDALLSEKFFLGAWANPSSSAYLKLVKVPVDTVDSFNNRPVNPESPIYDLEVAGVEIHINKKLPPWSLLTNGTIRQLKINADRIYLATDWRVPGAKIKLQADQIIIEEGAFLDITPLGYPSIFPAYTKGQNQGRDGRPGTSAGDLIINTNQLVLEGSSTAPRFIARGGSGENAGMGRSGEAGQSVLALGTTPKAVIRIVGPPVQASEYIGREDGHYKWVKHCRGDWPWGGGWVTECGKTEFKSYAEGSVVFPGDGGDAISAGHPGPGGAGGLVSIHTSKPIEIPSTWIDVSPGLPGLVAPDNPGGAAGQPRRAAILRGKNNGTDQGHYFVDIRESKEGRSAVSPRSPATTSPAGRVQIEVQRLRELSKLYLSNKLVWIRDLYLGGDYERVKKELDHLALRFTDRAQVLPLFVEFNKIQRLRLQLLNSQDYFGDELSKAPLYSVDIDMARFLREIDASLRVMSLASILETESDNLDKKRAALQSMIESAEKELAASIEYQNVATIDSGRLEVAFANLEKEEKFLREQLIEVENKINESARRDAESSEKNRKILQGLKTIAALSKVFPAGQPTLVSFGTALETLIRVPEQASVEDYLEYIDKNRGAFSRFEKEASWDRAQQDLMEYFRNFKPETYKKLSDEEALARFTKFYDSSKPLLVEIEKSVKSFEKTAVSPTEFQIALERLKASDPTFQGLIAQLKQVIKKREEMFVILKANYDSLMRMTEKVQSLIVIKSKGVEALMSDVRVLDAELTGVLQLLASQAEDRLLYYYQMLSRSFEYYALQPVQNKLNLGMITNQVRTALATAPVEERFAKVKEVYMMAVDSVANSVDRYLEKNPLEMSRVQSKDLFLTELQLRELNKNGSLSLKLGKEFYGSERKNIRIKNIEILEPTFVVQSLFSENVEANSIHWQIQLENFAHIEDQKGLKHLFTYYNYDSVYRWEAGSQLINGRVQHQQNPYDPQMRSVMASILRGYYPSLKETDFFATHGGLTSLRLTAKKERWFSGEVNAMGLRITFTYN